MNRRRLVVAVCAAGWLQSACSESPASDAADALAETDVAQSETTEPALDAVDTAPEEVGIDADGADTVVHDVSDVGDVGDVGVGEGIFAEGCPVPGQASARRIASPGTHMWGPGALGGVGDFLLVNERAAFVIQNPDQPKTYYYYGGAPIDAVAVEGCEQAGPERFDELGFLIGAPNVARFPHSVLRAFKGLSAEVVSDGSDGGEARLRVHGVDDYFWLVEMELVRSAFKSGDPKEMTQPLGVAIDVDYVLDPGSNVLRMEMKLTNESAGAVSALTGAVTFFGDTTEPRFAYDSAISSAGFNLKVGLPWLGATAPDGSCAVTMAAASVATTNISGVDALLDSRELVAVPRLAPGTSKTRTFLLAVGDSSINSAVAGLQPWNPTPIPNKPYTLSPIRGRVVLASDEPAPPETRVSLEKRSQDDRWGVLDEAYAAPDGSFEMQAPAFATGTYRLVAKAPGRDDGTPAPLPAAGVPVDLTLPAGGALRLEVRAEDGALMPVKVTLWRPDGTLYRRLYSRLEPTVEQVPPGRWEVTVSRGMEYEILNRQIEVPAGGEVRLTETLRRLLNTDGFLSTDTHLHGGPSTDSSVPVPYRFFTAAAEGVEAPVSSDHEIVYDWEQDLPDPGLMRWINVVVGEEVTPPLPEHSNMFPLVETPDEPRGGVLRWMRLDLAQLHAAQRNRGAEIVQQLNHPRLNCGYLCIIGYDRVTGGPTLADPTQLGFLPGAQLWDWDFDTVEVMNGHFNIFVDPANPAATGLFDDWLSFVNHGHPKTAVGVTDAHDEDAQGSPRTYFVAPTDEPSRFEDAMLVQALRRGQALVSAGAFARVALADGASLGDTTTVVGGEATLHVHVEALPEIDVTHFKVLVNCDEVATIATSDPHGLVKFDADVPLSLGTRDAYIVVMGFGANPLPRGLPQFDATHAPRFITNAIYVDVDGDALFAAPGGKECHYTL